MKQLIIFAIVFNFLSCGNEKSVIVEQIKAYKDSINVVARGELELSQEQTKLIENYTDSVRKINDKMSLRESQKVVEFNRQLMIRKAEAEIALSQTQRQRKVELYVDRVRFQSKIDSLELELKKY